MSDFEQLFSKYQEEYKKHKENQPYHFNILDEQQGPIVENSHTNILMKVLAYKNRYGYVFLKDFCESFFPALSVTNFEGVQIRREENRIDGLIYKKDEFAIIIENKVNHAENQKEQLQRYVNDIADTKYFPNENDAYKKIWVMYLTRDGIEIPDDESIGFMKDVGICYNDSEKESLDGERYFAANYSENIYPWLKEKVLPMVPFKDESLKCGLLQYIDFLEGFLGFRKQSEEIEKAARQILVSDFGSIKVVDRNKKLEELYNYIITINDDNKDGFEEMKNHFLGVIKRYNREPTKEFAAITKQIFTGQLLDCEQWYDECHITSNFNLYYITIRNSRWPKSVHFEWYALKMNNLKEAKEYNFQFHVEDKNLLEKFNQDKKLQEILEKLKYQKSQRSKKYEYPYFRTVESEKPILEMSKDELTKFLRDAYNKCINDDLIECIDRILNSQK